MDEAEIQRALAAAREARRGNRLAEAATLLQGLIARAGEHPVALNMLGLTVTAQGDGEKAEALFHRAIAADPEIIFFDEPTTGLDPIMADIINKLIVDCVKRLGATTISITHDMASARKIGHRIAMLYEGKLIWQGRTADIDHSGDAHVDQFIHGRAEGPIQMQVRKL